MSGDVTTFGSVCSGIEAASVAFLPLGWESLWLAEIEAAPSQILRYHYPDTPNVGDMTKIPQLLRNGDIRAPDSLWGGTPCQAFSVAGSRNSLDDARGNLSLTYCDIANEIDIQRAAAGLLPCIIGWENVPGVLNTKDNAFGCFLGQLAGEDEALVPEPCPLVGKSSRWWRWDKKTGQHAPSWPDAGVVLGPKRAVAWRVLDAQYFGVAQRRKRVLVVGSAREGFDPAAVLFEFEGLRRDSAPSREQAQVAAAGTLRSTDSGSDVDHARAGHLQPVVSTLDASYGRLQGCSGQDANHGHSHLLPVARTVALRGREGGATAELGDEIATCLRASTGGGDKPHVLAPICFSSKDYGADASVDLAPTLRAGGHSDSHANAGILPAIAFDARQDCVSSTEVFGALGSSSPQAQAVCVTGDVTHTLKAEGFDASEDGTGRGQPIVATTGTLCAHTYTGGAGGRPDMATQGYFQPVGMAVRRLTPRECERLQGFQWRCSPSYPGAWQDERGVWWSPDYTLIPGRRKNVAPAKLDRDYIKYLMRSGGLTFEQCMNAMADGPRYKALGNSWAVPKFRWLGQRIDAALRQSSQQLTTRRAA